MEGLTEDEKRALRGSKFAPLPSARAQTLSEPRQAHPGGPMTTNKAVALAKFLERKLQEPNGLASVDPRMVELAVKNAKQTVQLSMDFLSSKLKLQIAQEFGGGSSTSGRIIHHVNTFGDFEASDREEKTDTSVSKKLKQKKKKEKKAKKVKNKLKNLEDSTANTSKRPKKKMKL